MEAGFTSTVPGMSCLGSNTVDGGIDTKTAEVRTGVAGMIALLIWSPCTKEMVAKFCPGSTITVLDTCGGHAVPYHYHERMSCLFSASTVTGSSIHITGL